MERIRYGSTMMFTTGDRIAAIVMEYAQRLAASGGFDVLEVPLRRRDGTVGRASLLLGPTTTLVAETLPHGSGPADLDVVDEDWVLDLELRCAELRAFL